MQITTLEKIIFHIRLFGIFNLPLWLSMKTLTHTDCCFDLERLDCLASLTSENQKNIRTHFIMTIFEIKCLGLYIRFV